MAVKLEIFTNKSKQYSFHLKVSNGEIIAIGEAYSAKATRLKGIVSFYKNDFTVKIDTPEEDTAKPKTAKRLRLRKRCQNCYSKKYPSEKPQKALQGKVMQ
jgi:uncharacterized protein YegP (UPF0339 family)